MPPSPRRETGKAAQTKAGKPKNGRQGNQGTMELFSEASMFNPLDSFAGFMALRRIDSLSSYYFVPA